MHLAWNDRRTRQFITNVGLITSNGPDGPDIMAAEWTHHISYSPSLIAINVRGHNTTAENIQSSREFGVNLAAADQNIVCSVAGRYSGKETDKILLLKEAGLAVFYNAKSINVLMVQDAAMNAECKLMKQIELGDHLMFVGEVVEISADENIKPLIYHNGRYRQIGEDIPKPSANVLATIEKLAEKYNRPRY
ncbi:MAG TPA: flavin reductase family protein [Nitrososphaeraceae archaeon]|nr:flavin reductase family protein [Nitrososphaeraceae archaeon]